MVSTSRRKAALIFLLLASGMSTDVHAQAPVSNTVTPSVAVRFRLSDYEEPQVDESGYDVLVYGEAVHEVPLMSPGDLPSLQQPSSVDSLTLNEATSDPSYAEDFFAEPIADPRPKIDHTWFEPASNDQPPPLPTAVRDSASMPSDSDDCCLPRIWASAEYVLWWTDDANLPALVATSVSGTAQDQAARLGVPSTSVLFGQDDVDGGSRSGARFTLGGWLDIQTMFGVELTFLVLGNDESRFRGDEDFEILGRPFFNHLNSEQDAKLIDFPGLVQGNIATEIKTGFHTGEALLRKRVTGWGYSQVDWYLGYRNAGLTDEILITESSTILSGPVTGGQLFLSDQFRTRNTFHGVNLGVRYGATLRPTLEFELSGRVALGTRHTETEILGASSTTVGGTTTDSEIGFLVQPTNRGVFSDSSFSTVSDFGVLARRMFRPGLSLTVGYNFLFWHEVIRAGDQIDVSINTSQFPPGVLTGAPRPSIPNRSSNYWAHGFRIGFEYLF